MSDFFTHFLITRFNIVEKTWFDVDKHGQPTCDDKWMEHRFELFEKYCVPSVRAQSCKKFTWLVMIDKHTPTEYRQTVAELGGTVLLTTTNWLEELQLFLKDKARWLITTRLDNDDAIAPWLIQQVQDNFTNQRFTFLDFPVGYRLKNGILHKHREACNPFLSLVEEGSKSVLSQTHGYKLGQNNDVLTISHLPSWIQVIHDRNKITDKTPGPVTEPTGWVRQYVS